MAIKKEIPTNYGVSCSYWVIRSIHMETLSRSASFTVNGYVSPEALKEGKSPLDTRDYSLSGEDYESLSKATGVEEFLYEWMLKRCAEFCD